MLRKNQLSVDTRIYMFAKFHAKSGKEEQLRLRLLEMVVHTRKEEGCVFYNLHLDREQSDVFYFMECWKDQAALDFHMNTSYVQAILKDSVELTEGGIEISYMNLLEE